MQSETLRQLQSQYELLLRDGDPASRASAWQTIVDMKVRTCAFMAGNYAPFERVEPLLRTILLANRVVLNF